MRKYMNIINRLLFGAVALAALSCTGNFETYNRNPDQPSTIDRDVWDYIKSMQYNVIPTVKNQYQIVENVSGGAYGRYFAYAKSTDAGWNTGMFAFYRIANDWANPPYEVPMTNIYSNWRAIKAELEEPEDDYRMALAQIIRVAAMQRVTDIQGPIPYRTMENNDDLTAPYQSQEAVYGFMLEDLDHAVNVLETYITLAGTDVVAEAASADYVYNGNLAKWIRFANSLKAPSGHAHLERVARCRTICRRGRRAPLRRDRIERGQRLARRLPDQRPESAPLAGRGLQRRACGGRDRHLHEEPSTTRASPNISTLRSGTASTTARA